MNDGTRTPSSDSEARSWLDPLVASHVRHQVVSSIEVGRLLLPLANLWADGARKAIAAFEVGLHGRDVPDDLFALLEQRVGIRDLADLVAELAEASDRVAVSEDDD